MTDHHLILRKLTSLAEHVRRARRRRPDDVTAFRNDVDLQDALSMSLLVAVQEALDIALHLASDEGWGIPASYAQSFTLLAQQAVLDVELARDLANLASLRNRIAHGYATVEMERIWTELPAGLGALERFAAAIAAWLASH